MSNFLNISWGNFGFYNYKIQIQVTYMEIQASLKCFFLILNFKAFCRGCTERSCGHNVKIFVCVSVYICFFLVTSIQRHCQTSYSIAKILLMTPIVPLENFTPFLCRTKIGNFVRQPQKWKSPSKWRWSQNFR